MELLTTRIRTLFCVEFASSLSVASVSDISGAGSGQSSLLCRSRCANRRVFLFVEILFFMEDSLLARFGLQGIAARYPKIVARFCSFPA